MKANNGTGNNSERDEWETPQWLFNTLNSQYNFDIDCCASERNKKCNNYKSKFETSCLYPPDLKLNYKVGWMNPPFSKATEMFKTFFSIIGKGVAIYRCDNMETKIWQEIIFPNATWIFIPDKRIAYEGMEGSGSRFPSALIGFNVEKIKRLGGITLTPSNEGNLIPVRR